MASSDYSKQVVRRQRIKETTLVIGLDIGNDFNAMGLMNKEGAVLGRYPKIYNSRQGFNYFTKVIEDTKRKHNLNDTLIGMEPTGHYWRKIAYFAKEKGYEIRFVKTTSLKHQRELDESSSAKCDIKDALTISNITREGKYIDTIIEDGILRQLRTLAKVRERIQRYNNGSQNALRAVLDDYFPELKETFWSMKAKGLWAILDNCPFPKDVLRLGPAKIGDIIAKSSRRKAKATEKAHKLYEAAKESIGLKDIGIADSYRLKTYLEELKHSEVQLKDIEIQMKKLLKQVPYAEYILSIPGVGILSTAIFLGELGNPYYFRNPKAIIKYAGYDPIENDSGQRIGRRIISKKGRWLLRKFIYFMSMSVIRCNKFFKDYYHRKLEGRNRFGAILKKKEGICAVAIKLIKVIFALLRDKRAFTAEASRVALAI